MKTETDMRLLKLLVVLSGSLILACSADVVASEDAAGSTTTTGGTTAGTTDGATTGDSGGATNSGGATTGTDGAACDDVPAWSGDGTEEGQVISDITLQNCAKDQVTLTDRMCGKKLMLIEFGAGWCVSCRENQPHLKALYEKHSECMEVFTILRENQDPNDPATSSFCNEWKSDCAGEGCGELPFDVLIDPLDKEVGKFLAGGGTFPITLLLDREGNILLKAVGEVGDVDEIIEAACEQ
jgi:thiol-disulfide isomerase/thioredoxin